MSPRLDDALRVNYPLIKIEIKDRGIVDGANHPLILDSDLNHGLYFQRRSAVAHTVRLIPGCVLDVGIGSWRSALQYVQRVRRHPARVIRGEQSQRAIRGHVQLLAPPDDAVILPGRNTAVTPERHVGFPRKRVWSPHGVSTYQERSSDLFTG